MANMMRSLLFVPGNRPKMLDKAPASGADAVVLDIEDSVPITEKVAARQLVRERIRGLGDCPCEVWSRVNAIGTGLTSDDIAAVVGEGLRGIVLPKVQSAADVQQVSLWLDAAEDKAGIPTGTIAIIADLETARGVLNAREVADGGGARLAGLSLGAEDFCTDLGIARTKEAVELFLPRATIALCARAAEVQAVDVVFADFSDDEGLRRETAVARGLGFQGKFAIHPRQIPIINEIFTPSAAEIEHARRVVAAFESAQSTGSAAVSLDGKMVDTPIYTRARRLLGRL